MWKLVPDAAWIDKIVQLYGIQQITHGIMIVGKSGSGKSTAIKILFQALQNINSIDGKYYIIGPKSFSKEYLYGHVDNTTREWTDGVFTGILRRIIADVRGEGAKLHWIIFDGEVDPEWVENLNSVMDDNKILTLPNGERLALPKSVRLLFEVEHLDEATPATISRCGMVWFPDNLISTEMIAKQFLSNLKTESIEHCCHFNDKTDGESDVVLIQRQVAGFLEPLFGRNGTLEVIIAEALKFIHIMPVTQVQISQNLFSLMSSSISDILNYNTTHDFSMEVQHMEMFVMRSFFISLAWAVSCSLSPVNRKKIAATIMLHGSSYFPTNSRSPLDFDVNVNTGDVVLWKGCVPRIDLDSNGVSRTDIVIPTLETMQHEKVIYALLEARKFILLCGPPGSGKTMMLLSALRRLPNVDLLPLNFSSETTSSMIIKTLETHCVYRKTSKGYVLEPRETGRWAVVFCDEINLPKPDSYGTQGVLSLLRLLIEQHGFWDAEKLWVAIERIQFVGACNPSSDPGRHQLSPRFLRHCPVLLVDYPGTESLITIYGSFCRGALKVAPNLRGFSDAVTYAMVEFYSTSKDAFPRDAHSHYIYSPRELTRWVRGLHEIIRGLEYASLEDLIRCWAHEGLRLFQDRLVTNDEKVQSTLALHAVAAKHFPNVDIESCCVSPILFSNFISNQYCSVEYHELLDFTRGRMKAFCEEELNEPIVLFDSALEHILRIDRVLRQPQGHMLLIGLSGSGKSTLVKFVAWMNGISLFQPKMHKNYHIANFDDDLRIALKRASCKNEKICLLIDESNVEEASFLERINTLLANSEIPGLFEGDEYTSLMSGCKEASLRDGIKLENHDETYDWFTQRIMKNLHVVFTMNPPEGSMNNRASTSPALFNRCVLNWMGDWDLQAMYQVGSKYLEHLVLDYRFEAPKGFQPCFSGMATPPSIQDAIVDVGMFVHAAAQDVFQLLKRNGNSSAYITPKNYLDFVKCVVLLLEQKRDESNERQNHLIVGLDRLKETLTQVEELRISLRSKNEVLECKTNQANEKLKIMVGDQQEAENKRAVSVEIHEDLLKQNTAIEERSSIVRSDLKKAEPAVAEAQASVSNIKRQHLNEMRAMVNPPGAVKMTMEAVCIFLGHKVDSWKSVQGVLRRDDFISSIVNYSTDMLTTDKREEIISVYIEDPSFTFELVNRASTACGPLFKWITAQIDYSTILERVGPLRAEVSQLEAAAEETRKKDIEVNAVISQLEQSINVYKEEYAVLISESQILKSEMEAVKLRVDRSVRILDNLSSEQERWETSRLSFKKQQVTLVGDILLSSTLLNYGGYLDQGYRAKLITQVKTYLTSAGMKFQAILSFPEYLVSAEQQSEWFNNKLPADPLCIENAVIIEKSRRYPLIIDPAGQALAYLKAQFKSNNVVVSSFRDTGFLKLLEIALRFGNAIILQDAEYYDPIMNDILRKQTRRSGGRTICAVGAREIDVSPNFKLFLITKNSNLSFTPDISSRVCFVNFTITPASLRLQCLDSIMKAERNDIEMKRQELIKIQHHYQLRLHQIGKELLDSLNQATGNILDDDVLMDTLETVKREALEIVEKFDQTDIILDEVNVVTSQFMPLATSCSAVFFVLESLPAIQPYYQFSLDYFFSLFDQVLRPNCTTPRSIGKLEAEVFFKMFVNVSTSLRDEDVSVFAMLLAAIKDQESIQEKQYFLNGCTMQMPVDKIFAQHFDAQVAQDLSNLAQIQSFGNQILDLVTEDPAPWVNLLTDKCPEISVAEIYINKSLSIALLN